MSDAGSVHLEEEAHELGPPTPLDEDTGARWPWLRARHGLGQLIGRYGTIIAFVALFAFFSIKSEHFLEWQNLFSILDQSTHLGIIAAGLTVTLVMLDFDLSVGYNATLANMYAAGVALSFGTGWGFFLGIVTGIVIGALNGLVVTLLNVSAFITTLGAGFIIQGIIFGYRSGGQISFGLPDDFGTLGNGHLGNLTYEAMIMLGVMLAIWVLLQQTPLGRKMYAIGGNPVAARLSGIHIGRIRFIAFVISGTCASLAGILLASNLTSSNPTVGLGYLLEAFAACFIGAATLRDGEFHIGGTLLGVLLLRMLTNGLIQVGIVGTDWPYIIEGAILIAALALSGVLRRTAAR